MITSIKSDLSQMNGNLVSVLRIGFKDGKKAMMLFDESGKMITKNDVKESDI